MKIIDIQVGHYYALPANEVSGFGGWKSRGGMLARGTAAHVSEGVHAAPCRVVAVGKFRQRQSGACVYEIVEDHHTTTVHVQVPDVSAITNVDYKHADDSRIGFPNGLSLRSKKIAWVDRVVAPTRLVIPWSSFLKRREERAFVQAEVAAYQERIVSLKNDLYRLVINESGLVDRTENRISVQFGTVTDRGAFRWRSVENADHVDIQCDYIIPIKAIDAAGPIVAEIRDLQKKIACQR